MKLTTKAKIYRYTGWYLAEKEELEYINSQEAINYINKLASEPDNDLTIDEATGLVIGLWQSEYGFCRPMNFIRYQRPGFIFRPIAWVQDFITAVRREWK